jgi:hypothetical protein
METVAHEVSVENTDIGCRPICVCGWKGGEKDRMSDDYAFTNAMDDGAAHLRSAKNQRECAEVKKK